MKDKDTVPWKSLVIKAKAGDKEAAKTLFTELYPHIYSFVNKYAENYPTSETAEEIIQDAILRIYQSLDKFDPNKSYSFFPWSMRITKNILINFLRRSNYNKKAISAYKNDFDSTLDSLINYSIDDSLIQNEYLDIINKAIKQLEPKEQNIIKDLIKGKNQHEIKKKYEISSLYLSKLFNKTRKKLLKVLEQEGY